MQNRRQFWQKSADLGMKMGRWLFDRYRVGLHPEGMPSAQGHSISGLNATYLQ